MQLLDLAFEEELNIMTRFSLTYEELIIIKLIFFIQESDINYKYCNIYFNECRKEPLKREELITLRNKKVITKESYIPEVGDPILLDELEFTSVFSSYFYKKSNQLGKELWEEYPFWICTNKMNYPVKNFSKRFKDLNDLFSFYGKSIRYNRDYHYDIIKALKYAKENDLITCNIVDYLVGQQWEQHIKIMEGKDKTINPTFNTIELL